MSARTGNKNNISSNSLCEESFAQDFAGSSGSVGKNENGLPPYYKVVSYESDQKKSEQQNISGLVQPTSAVFFAEKANQNAVNNQQGIFVPFMNKTGGGELVSKDHRPSLSRHVDDSVNRFQDGSSLDQQNILSSIYAAHCPVTLNDENSQDFGSNNNGYFENSNSQAADQMYRNSNPRLQQHGRGNYNEQNVMDFISDMNKMAEGVVAMSNGMLEITIFPPCLIYMLNRFAIQYVPIHVQ